MLFVVCVWEREWENEQKNERLSIRECVSMLLPVLTLKNVLWPMGLTSGALRRDISAPAPPPYPSSPCAGLSCLKCPLRPDPSSQLPQLNFCNTGFSQNWHMNSHWFPTTQRPTHTYIHTASWWELSLVWDAFILPGLWTRWALEERIWFHLSLKLSVSHPLLKYLWNWLGSIDKKLIADFQ